MTEITLDKSISSLNLNEFIEKYGGLYEHSPWIAERAFVDGVTESCATVDQLHDVLKQVVTAAEAELKLSLILAHPDLACAPERLSDLTDASQNEQSGAGLDRCSAEEYQAFQDLNRCYRDKFGFPFIIAVKGLHRTEILAEFQRRINNDRAREFNTDLIEIHKIAYWRLRQLADKT